MDLLSTAVKLRLKILFMGTFVRLRYRLCGVDAHLCWRGFIMNDKAGHLFVAHSVTHANKSWVGM